RCAPTHPTTRQPTPPTGQKPATQTTPKPRKRSTRPLDADNAREENLKQSTQALVDQLRHLSTTHRRTYQTNPRTQCTGGAEDPSQQVITVDNPQELSAAEPHRRTRPTASRSRSRPTQGN